MPVQTQFTTAVLALDCTHEIQSIVSGIQRAVFDSLHRKGIVVGISGGIDSSVTAALCVEALGSDRVLGLIMPEADSSPESAALASRLAEHLGVRTITEDITPALQAFGCYRRRDQAIRAVLPDYTSDWKFKIILPEMLGQDRYSIYSIEALAPDGSTCRTRLGPNVALEIVAATNFKQRVRKTFEYYHSDRLQYAVAGTPNRLEYDQGFFVKLGDGAADVKPIAHLYKTQVFQLADYLGIPEDIRRRQPTTDTYSLPQSQEEFYFSVPLATMDLCLYGYEHGIALSEVAEATGLTSLQVRRVNQQIEHHRRAAQYLQAQPILLQPLS